MEIAHFYVIGRVQGVGYRAWTVRTARQLGLSGWVRNRINGSVEIYASGSEQSINLLRQMCLKGPLWSRVTHLEAVTIPESFIPIEEGVFGQKPTL